MEQVDLAANFPSECMKPFGETLMWGNVDMLQEFSVLFINKKVGRSKYETEIYG